jgi:hypothetical protein
MGEVRRQLSECYTEPAASERETATYLSCADKVAIAKSMIFLPTELTESGGIRNKAAGKLIAIDIYAAKPLQEGGFVA